MSGDFSREALRARLGEQAFADAEACGAAAPDPSPELVERVRRILAPALRRIAAQSATTNDATPISRAA